MLAVTEQCLRALLLEGYLGYAPGTYAQLRTPMQSLERSLGVEDLDTAAQLRKLGWFDCSAAQLYRTLRVHGDDAANYFMATPKSGHLSCPAHRFGAWMASRKIKLNLSRVRVHLSLAAWRGWKSLQRAWHERVDVRGLSPITSQQAAPAERSPEPLGLIYEALTDAADPLGQVLRGRMRLVFRQCYDRMVRKNTLRLAVPPMLWFVDELERGRVPSYGKMASVFIISEPSIRQRHANLLMAQFAASLTSRDISEVAQTLVARGCSPDQAPQWADSLRAKFRASGGRRPNEVVSDKARLPVPHIRELDEQV